MIMFLANILLSCNNNKETRMKPYLHDTSLRTFLHFFCNQEHFNNRLGSKLVIQ